MPPACPSLDAASIPTSQLALTGGSHLIQVAVFGGLFVAIGLLLIRGSRRFRRAGVGLAAMLAVAALGLTGQVAKAEQPCPSTTTVGSSPSLQIVADTPQSSSAATQTTI